MVEYFDILRKYNFWDNPIINTGLIRDSYLSKVEGYIDTKLIKVFVGQRRVGKSYLMRQIISRLINNGINPKNIFYFNKEIVEFEYINSYDALNDLIKTYETNIKPQGKKYLFFDEIQMVNQWEKLINSLSQDYVEDYEVFITGSNSRLLSGELSSLLSGRYIEFEVFPYSFEEFVFFNKLDKNKVSLIQYLKTGGLPEFYNLPNEEIRINYLNALVDTIILRDIVQRYRIKDTSLLLNVFRYLVSNVGFLVSAVNLVNYLKQHRIQTNYETITSYLDYLSDSFLIHPVDRYDVRGKEILKGVKKYYVNDLSFYNYIKGFTQSFGLGQLLENYVYLNLKQNGYQVYIGAMQNREIDFVIEKGSEKKYIQVSYLLADNDVINREFKNLEAIKDNFEKIVVSLDDISIGNKQGIKHLCAWEL